MLRVCMELQCNVKEVTMFTIAADMRIHTLTFLFTVFSQAGGVNHLLADEAQHSAVMEKTRVGPTGGRVYV